jgi:hypothetical protein
VVLVVDGIVFAVVGVVRLDHAIQRPATQGLNTERQGELRNHRLSLRTTPGAYAFQLTSPPRLLGPGDYAALVDGRVVRGGLQMAIIDSRISRTIGQSFYWSGQTYTATTRMVVPFTLARPTQVYLALANFGDLGNPSLWSLRSFDLGKQRGGCRLSTPYAWFTPATSGSP